MVFKKSILLLFIQIKRYTMAHWNQAKLSSRQWNFEILVILIRKRGHFSRETPCGRPTLLISHDCCNKETWLLCDSSIVYSECKKCWFEQYFDQGPLGPELLSKWWATRYLQTELHSDLQSVRALRLHSCRALYILLCSKVYRLFHK